MPSKYQKLNSLQWSSRCGHFCDNSAYEFSSQSSFNWNKQVYFTISSPCFLTAALVPALQLISERKKNVNLCLMLINSVKVTARCRLTCFDTFCCGSSLLLTGQGSLCNGQSYQGSGQRLQDLWSEFYAHAYCAFSRAPSSVRYEQRRGV